MDLLVTVLLITTGLCLVATVVVAYILLEVRDALTCAELALYALDAKLNELTGRNGSLHE